MLYIEGHIQRVMQRYIKQRGLSQCHLGTVPDRQRTALKFRANFCCGCENGRCGSSGGSDSAVAVAGFSAVLAIVQSTEAATIMIFYLMRL